MEHKLQNGKLLRMLVGDITKVPTDGIVNAANSALAGGGGVDGAIHRAGGPSIMQELDQIRANAGGCPTGSAVVTGAGHLPAQLVFHAVGPVYRDGKHQEHELLALCYRKCLELAEEHAVKIISFPSISTGAYRYPIRDAARIAVREALRHLERPDAKVQEVVFVLFSESDYEVYSKVV